MAKSRVFLNQLELSTTTGSLPYTDGSNEQVYLAPGTNGQVLSLVAGAPAWINSTASLVFQNGLTETAPSTVTWGGTLLQDTSIDGAFRVRFGDTTAITTFSATTTGTITFTAGVDVITISTAATSINAGTDLTLTGTAALKLATPAVVATTATVGQVPVLTNVDGTIEYQDVSTAFQLRSDQTGITGTAVTIPATPLTAYQVYFYRNGVLQTVGGGNDYTIAGAAITTTTALTALETVTILYY